MRACYLVGFIDKKTLKIIGAGLYSESAKHLTIHIDAFAVDILEIEKPTFHEALQYMRTYLNDPEASKYFDWIKPLIKPSGLQE